MLYLAGQRQDNPELYRPELKFWTTQNMPACMKLYMSNIDLTKIWPTKKTNRSRSLQHLLKTFLQSAKVLPKTSFRNQDKEPNLLDFDWEWFFKEGSLGTSASSENKKE